MTEAIVSEFPETEDNDVNKVIERVFPAVRRYIVILRVSTQKLRYVIHRRNAGAKIIEWDVLEKDLPAFTKKTKIIKEIVQEAIKNVQE